jgi:hypothetical protein
VLKGLFVTEIFDSLSQLITVLGRLLGEILYLLMGWSLLIGWLAWWLAGVNWKRLWPVLAQGAWAPAVLALGAISLVWSQIDPKDCTCLGFAVIPNFWWQLGSLGLLAAVTLFCGWLQGVFGWTPTEIDLEPPAVAHDHGHGHH